MRIVDDATVRSVLDLQRLTDATVSAFAALGRGDAATTTRVRAQSGAGMASALAAVLPERNVSGGKLYATSNGRFSFVVVAFDLEGRVLGVLEAASLTALRTAAATGAAIRLLGGNGAGTVALVGTGSLLAEHLAIVAQEVATVRELRVVGRRQESLDRAAASAEALGLPVTTSVDATEAVAGADLVITLTSASEPLFPGDALADGALVCALGATKPDRRELDARTVQRAGTVVVDLLEGAKTECGDLVQAVAEGSLNWDRVVELGAVAAGSVSPDRQGVTLFESQGIALQDVVAASLVLESLG